MAKFLILSSSNIEYLKLNWHISSSTRWHALNEQMLALRRESTEQLQRMLPMSIAIRRSILSYFRRRTLTGISQGFRKLLIYFRRVWTKCEVAEACLRTVEEREWYIKRRLLEAKLDDAIWKPGLELSSIADGLHPKLIMFSVWKLLSLIRIHLNSTFLQHQKQLNFKLLNYFMEYFTK
jgi:hypothetical protein